MKSFSQFRNVTLILLTILFLSASSIVLKAQNAVNFSGKWQYDKTASKPDKFHHDFEGTEVLEITQNSETISLVKVFIREGSPDWKTNAEIFKLDGTEEITKSRAGTIKSSVKWSTDKKLLTVKNLATQTSNTVLQEFITEDTYSLSADGKTLTIDQRRDNPNTGELKGTLMYRMK